MSRIKKSIILICLIVAIVPLFFLLIEKNCAKVARPKKDILQTNAALRNELSSAWNLYFTANTAEAIVVFKGILEEEKSNDAEKVQALLGLGVCYSLGIGYCDKEKAIEYYDRIASNYPDSMVTPWALLKTASLYDVSVYNERKKSRAVLENILERYPNSSVIHEAKLRLSSTYFRELDHAETLKGISILENHLEEYPENELASTMLFRLAYWYASVEKDYEKSLHYRLRLADIKMADPHRWSLQYWGIAQTYRLKLHDYEKALYWYNRILEECPRDLLNYPARICIDEIESEIGSQQKE